MVAAVRACWSHVTPKNVAVTIAASSVVASGVGFGLGFWSTNTAFSVVAAVTLIFSAFLVGTSAKYMPTGTLEKVVNHLSTLPSQFMTFLKGTNGQSPGLDQIVAELQKTDLSQDQDAQALKQILVSAQSTVASMKDVNAQYLALIASFEPFLDQIGSQNKTYVNTARQITSILGHVKTQDLESGQLTHLSQELPQQVKDLQANLQTLGTQILQSQQQTVANTDDLTAKIAENNKLLQEIADARTALAKAEAEFQEKTRGSAAA